MNNTHYITIEKTLVVKNKAKLLVHRPTIRKGSLLFSASLIFLGVFWVFLALDVLLFQGSLFQKIGFLLISRALSYMAIVVACFYILDAILVWKKNDISSILTLGLLTITVPFSAILIIFGLGILAFTFVSLAPPELSLALMLIGIFSIGLNAIIAIHLYREWDILY